MCVSGVSYYFSLVLKDAFSILSHQEIRPRFPGHLRCDWEQISGASENFFVNYRRRPNIDEVLQEWEADVERREWSQQPETCQVPRIAPSRCLRRRRGESEAAGLCGIHARLPVAFFTDDLFPAVEIDLGQAVSVMTLPVNAVIYVD